MIIILLVNYHIGGKELTKLFISTTNRTLEVVALVQNISKIFFSLVCSYCLVKMLGSK